MAQQESKNNGFHNTCTAQHPKKDFMRTYDASEKFCSCTKSHLYTEK